MVILADNIADPLEAPALRSMFEARKEVFVDLLKWDIPVIDGRFEIDQFDDEHATYIIVCDREGAHLGSARLLKSTRPHILDTLFAELCAAPLPRGPGVLEITRFCLGRRQGKSQRLETRNLLVSALVRFALANGIETYSGVAEIGWLQQILAFGWRCRPLGLPQRIGGRTLGALRIDVTQETPALLESNGIHRETMLEPAPVLQAA
jgi:N-acyl-L-homoserine lactone synthetase